MSLAEQDLGQGRPKPRRPPLRILPAPSASISGMRRRHWQQATHQTDNQRRAAWSLRETACEASLICPPVPAIGPQSWHGLQASTPGSLFCTVDGHRPVRFPHRAAAAGSTMPTVSPSSSGSSLACSAEASPGSSSSASARVSARWLNLGLGLVGALVGDRCSTGPACGQVWRGSRSRCGTSCPPSSVR